VAIVLSLVVVNVVVVFIVHKLSFLTHAVPNTFFQPDVSDGETVHFCPIIGIIFVPTGHGWRCSKSSGNQLKRFLCWTSSTLCSCIQV